LFIPRYLLPRIVEEIAVLATDNETIVEDIGHHVIAGSLRVDVEVSGDGVHQIHVFIDFQFPSGTNHLDVSQEVQRC